MLNKPQGYDESYAFTGESFSLPAGKYVCKIVKAQLMETQRAHRTQLVLLFDVADGEYKDYYRKQFNAAKGKDQNATWKGVHKQIIDGSSLPFFKGLMTAIEKSNPGYEFPWGRENNEKTLVDKKLGMVMGREQFKASDGSLKWATKVVQVRSLDGLADAKIPEDKPYEEPQGNIPYVGPAANDGWMQVPEGVQEELPFN
nr:MAG TPA: Protein of unknown function (DUF669) [Caudoviricetes sp.]